MQTHVLIHRLHHVPPRRQPPAAQYGTDCHSLQPRRLLGTVMHLVPVRRRPRGTVTETISVNKSGRGCVTESEKKNDCVRVTGSASGSRTVRETETGTVSGTAWPSWTVTDGEPVNETRRSMTGGGVDVTGEGRRSGMWWNASPRRHTAAPGSRRLTQGGSG